MTIRSRSTARARALGFGAIAVAAAVLTGCSPTPTHEPTGAGTSQTPVASAAPADLTYLALGDSNVFGAAADCGDCTTYPHLVQRRLATETGKTIRLIDASQHNQLTAVALAAEIDGNDWSDPVASSSEIPAPEDAIGSADLITLTISDNQIPWQRDDDPCAGEWSSRDCLSFVEKPFLRSLGHLLARIVTIRAGKPTAIRVTNEYNSAIPSDTYAPDWPAAAVARSKTSVRAFLDRWNHDLCAVVVKHHALCVDIYHAINGPRGTTALPAGWFTPQYGDLNQPGHDFIAAKLMRIGWKPVSLD